jgi:hypothetical protein
LGSLCLGRQFLGEPIYVEDAKDSLWVKWILNYLKKNLAITILWGDWDGHYQDIIGYDTMGTPSIGDDMLVLADSYDTSDHLQDGYYCYPAERFYSMWVERNVVSKPYQVQQFRLSAFLKREDGSLFIV